MLTTLTEVRSVVVLTLKLRVLLWLPFILLPLQVFVPCPWLLRCL